jgi:NADPH:quinone reductase-like Zn-dependent oxidoreductase
MRRFGGSEVLGEERVPDPRPEPGQAVIAVEAAAVGHFDVDLRLGVSRIELAFPHILGSEAVGRVVELPQGYAGPLAVGERVMVPEEEWCGVCESCRAGRENACDDGRMLGVERPGTYAELITARATELLPIGDDLAAADWAAVQVAFGTAWHMLVTRAGLAPGERVLVTGAAGGVGSAGIQIARLTGATVIAAARGEAKLGRLRDLGAVAAVDYEREPLAQAVLELTAGRGVDVVLEHVGGRVLGESLACLAKGGRIVTCGAHAGEIVPLDVIQLFRREQTVIGSRTCTLRELETVIRLVTEHRLVPVVDSVFPLAGAADAHRRLESREHVGKIVLAP